VFRLWRPPPSLCPHPSMNIPLLRSTFSLSTLLLLYLSPVLSMRKKYVCNKISGFFNIFK
jgi:hypothetical protein